MFRSISVIALGALVAIGCGSGGPPKAKLYPVTGKVTVGGKPLADCTIVLTTENPAANASPGYSGKLNANGEFTLSDPVDGRQGAAVGKYKVTFALAPEAAMKAMQSGGKRPGYESKTAEFPKEYASADKSPKEVEVKAEPNVFNLDL